MSQNHPAMFYSTQKGLEEKIVEFFDEGISKNERCIFLTTQNDAQQILDRLCSLKEQNKIMKFFSYFYIPDPIKESERFKLKMNSLKKIILHEGFQGRVAFNVLGDMSRFSVEDILKIEQVEIYLSQISNNNLKLLCSFKIGTEEENITKIMKMAISTHDHIMFENEEEK